MLGQNTCPSDEREYVMMQVEEVRGQLRGDGFEVPVSWATRNSVRSVISLLMVREYVTYAQMCFACRRDLSRESSDPRVLANVYVYHARRALKPLGVTIHNLVGQGFYIDSDGKASLRRQAAAGPTFESCAEMRLAAIGLGASHE
ncbi:MAG: hypothetical protein QNI84_13320 [Henriciella sp.]|nr:hypothetical protein [Henriciella sp.]